MKGVFEMDVTRAITGELYEMLQKESGLYLLNLPTGASKTYSMYQAIAQYLCADDGKSKRPILFLTPQKKNLKQDSQKGIYLKAFHGSRQKAEASFEDDFLFLDNKRSYLDRYLMDKGKVGERFRKSLPESIRKSKAYKELIDALDACQGWERNQLPSNATSAMQRMNAEYGEKVQQELTKCEKMFRYLVRQTVFQMMSGTAEDEMDGHDRGYQGQYLYEHIKEIPECCPWAVKLYPGTMVPTKRLIFLSFDKFLSGNVSLIPGMSDFMEVFGGTAPIIIIDEVDSTHKIWEHHILEAALSNTNDLIHVFCTLHDHLGKPDDIPDSIYRLGNRESKRKLEFNNDMDYLFNAADAIYQKYHLNLQLKYDCRENACLFGTSYYYTIGKAYSYLEYSEERNAMLIHVEDYDAYQDYKKRYEGREDECLYPTTMIKQIRGFFQTFQFYLQKWADLFANRINAKNNAQYQIDRQKAENPRRVYHPRSYTVQDATSTILDTLGISFRDKKTQQMVLDAGNTPIHTEKEADSWETFLKKELRLFRYFRSGYSLTEFENRDDHRERTELTYFSKSRTSEYKLLELAQQTMVIGLSATACMPSLSNYYLPFLKEELGDRFHPMSDSLQNALREFYREMKDSYQKHQVSIRTDVLRSKKVTHLSYEDTFKAFQKLYRSSSHAEAVAKEVWKKSVAVAQKQSHRGRKKEESISSDYILRRYYETAESVLRFFQSEHAHAWLFLNYPLPSDKPEFNETLLSDMVKKFAKEYPDRKACFKVLRSRGEDGQSFEASLQEVKNLLKKGENVLLFSSYQTIGTGINLDYESSFYEEDFVDIYPDDPNLDDDPRHRRRDFDGFVLGEITYLLNNVEDYLLARETKDPQTEVLRHQMISDVLTLEEINQIDYRESRKAIRTILSPAPNAFCLTNLFKDFKQAPYVAGQVQYLLTQALGRGNRAFLKNRHIQICCHANNLWNLYLTRMNGEQDNGIRTPEWKALSKMVDDEYGLADGATYKNKPDDRKMPITAQQMRTAENMCYREESTFRDILGMAFHRDTVWTEAKRKSFELLEPLVMCHPTFDSFDELLDTPGLTSEELARIQEYAKYGYLTFGEKVNAYHYVRLHDQRSVFPYLDPETKQDVLKRHGLELSTMSDLRGGTVSEYEADLRFLFRNLPGLEAYFKENGYATTFRKARYIMTPILFLNIYKGRLGEIVGSWILQKYGHLDLSSIQDLTHYEKFDRELPSGDFIDFKHWKFITGMYFTNQNAFYNKVYEKLESIRQEYPDKAAHAYIIRLCQTTDEDELLKFDNGAEFTYDNTMRIMTVPALLTPDGVNMKAINEICKNELRLRQERDEEE